MFEYVDGRTDDRVTGILIAHLGAFSSGELKSKSSKMLRIGVLFISQTLLYSFSPCVQNTPKIVTFVIGKMKLVPISLFLDASPPRPNTRCPLDNSMSL